MAVADLSSRSLSALISLADRVAVVTGGARGIGAAICRRFAEAGARVLVADLDLDAARETARGIAADGGTAQAVAVDVRLSASQDALAERALQEWGRLDIWVNCAGIYPSKALLDLSDNDWRQVLDLNLTGAFYGARAAARRMAEAGGGVILNLSSTAGLRPAGAGYVHYSSSKAGVIGLTQTLARELSRHNIRVLGLAPTFVHTPGTEANAAALKALAGVTGDEIGARLPLGRAGVPDDVARAALFCASDLSLFMTGATLPVDGGALVG